MVYTAYICEDFIFHEDLGVLIIRETYAEFTSNDSEMVLDLINSGSYNAVVCPQLYTNENGVRPKRIIFK